MTSKLTPYLIAKNGHIAAKLREEMNRQNVSPADLAEKLGTSVSAIHNWTAGKNAPAEKFRKGITKILGIPNSQLQSKVVSRQEPARLPTMAAVRTENLIFAIGSDGMCRLRLDVTLPIDHGVPLFRVLLDSGLVKGAQSESHDNA